ncbi:DUF4252 domain-containing protein [Kordia zhangzhouensis]|uniref:DUF4252 domain-containing protein n=1 Tax=Kordia zhangzhouensis TaxID=1620405 RepID=UPI00069B327B|nr:DUF4252 domain-containing protein [Kordia zhangzhouensis]
MKTLQSIVVVLFLFLGMTSCSDKNSLHNYILNNAEKIGFSSSTIPIGSLKGESLQLTEKQQEAFDAIQRVNVLLYKYDPNKEEEYSVEKKKIASILKQKKYEELIDLGNKGTIKYIGEEEEIDEIIIFVSNKELGFAITRIVGDDMTLTKFMELYQLVSQSDQMQLDLGGLSSYFK